MSLNTCIHNHTKKQKQTGKNLLLYKVQQGGLAAALWNGARASCRLTHLVLALWPYHRTLSSIKDTSKLLSCLPIAAGQLSEVGVSLMYPSVFCHPV